jgi:hypothetical protein
VKDAHLKHLEGIIRRVQAVYLVWTTDRDAYSVRITKKEAVQLLRTAYSGDEGDWIEVEESRSGKTAFIRPPR